jgi:hypothetical protein
MNIFEVFEKLKENDWLEFSNGYNKILHGEDEYEFVVTDNDNNKINLLATNWEIIKREPIVIELEDLSFLANTEQNFIFSAFLDKETPIKNGVGIWKLFLEDKPDLPILIKRCCLNGNNDFTFKLEKKESSDLCGRFIHKFSMDNKNFVWAGKINIFEKIS